MPNLTIDEQLQQISSINDFKEQELKCSIDAKIQVLEIEQRNLAETKNELRYIEASESSELVTQRYQLKNIERELERAESDVYLKEEELKAAKQTLCEKQIIYQQACTNLINFAQEINNSKAAILNKLQNNVDLIEQRIEDNIVDESQVFVKMITFTSANLVAGEIYELCIEFSKKIYSFNIDFIIDSSKARVIKVAPINYKYWKVTFESLITSDCPTDSLLIKPTYSSNVSVDPCVFDTCLTSDTNNINFTICGSLIDGFIKNAYGNIINLLNNTELCTLLTDEDGDFITTLTEFPDIFQIKFLPGGIDISTGLVSQTTFSLTLSNKQMEGNSHLGNTNVTPITSLVSNLIKIEVDKCNVGELTETRIETIIDEARTKIATLFNIDKNLIESNFIARSDNTLTLISNSIVTVLETISAAITRTCVNFSTDLVLECLVSVINDLDISSGDTFSFNNRNDIKKIIISIDSSTSNISLSTNAINNLTDLIHEIIQRLELVDTNLDITSYISELTKISQGSVNVITDTDNSLDITSDSFSVTDIITLIISEAATVEILTVIPDTLDTNDTSGLNVCSTADVTAGVTASVTSD